MSTIVLVLIIFLLVGAFGGGHYGLYPLQYGYGGGGLLLLILVLILLFR